MTCKIVCVCVRHKTKNPFVNPLCGHRRIKTVNDEAEKVQPLVRKPDGPSLLPYLKWFPLQLVFDIFHTCIEH